MADHPKGTTASSTVEWVGGEDIAFDYLYKSLEQVFLKGLALSGGPLAALSGFINH